MSENSFVLVGGHGGNQEAGLQPETNFGGQPTKPSSPVTGNQGTEAPLGGRRRSSGRYVGPARFFRDNNDLGAEHSKYGE